MTPYCYCLKRVVSLAACVLLTACQPSSPQASAKAESNAERHFENGLPEAKLAPLSSGIPDLDPPLPSLIDDYFSVFNLLANRPLAHRIENVHRAPTLVVDARAADFIRYNHANHSSDWLMNARVGETRGAAVKGRKASLWLPAFGLNPQAYMLQARVFNPARGQNQITVKVNGSTLAPVSLDTGWQQISIEIESSQVIRADNRIDIEFSNLGRIEGQLAGGALHWIRLAPKTDSPPQMMASIDGERMNDDSQNVDDTSGLPDVGGDDFDAESQHLVSNIPLEQGPLILEPGQGAAWHLWIPEEAQLSLDIEAIEGCGVNLDLLAEEGQGRISRILNESRILVDGRGTRQKTAINLSTLAGQVVRMELKSNEECDSAITLIEADIVVPGKRPEIPDVEPPKYVVFWVIDTLRADYLPIHFDTDVLAPNLKRLADEGSSFKLAYVHGTESRVSHASLFSGLYPNRHGVTGRGKVRNDVLILPQMMQQAGYKTAAFASNGYVSHLLNLNRGWDFFTNNIHQETSLDGMSMARDGIGWAKQNSEDPFFLYLGTIDPHVTYRRHKDIIDIYDTEPYNGRFQRFVSGDDLGLIKAKKLGVNERDKERIINLYKNEITFNDRAFGFLREQLEEAGIWDQTMVIVTSDHGEEFWEHGSVGHGHNIHQEMVHVPLIIYYPPLIPKGTVVEAGADIVDVFATVAHAIKEKRPENQQGKSLLPLIYNQHGGYPEPAVATQYLRHYAMQMQQWKLYMRRGEYQLYDRLDDHFELKNVADEHPLASRWLLDSMAWLRQYRAQWDKETWGAASNLRTGFFERLQNN